MAAILLSAQQAGGGRISLNLPGYDPWCMHGCVVATPSYDGFNVVGVSSTHHMQKSMGRDIDLTLVK